MSHVQGIDNREMPNFQQPSLLCYIPLDDNNQQISKPDLDDNIYKFKDKILNTINYIFVGQKNVFISLMSEMFTVQNVW